MSAAKNKVDTVTESLATMEDANSKRMKLSQEDTQMNDHPEYEIIKEEWRIQDNWTPLHEAVEELDLPKLKYLLDSGRFGVNAVTKETNMTALHYAVMAWNQGEKFNDQLEAIKLLVRHGANLDPHDCVGKTPLHIVAKTESLDLTRMLIQLGANVNVDNREPERPVKDCEGDCACGNRNALRGIFAAVTGGNFSSSKYRKDATPLHDAASAGNYHQVKLLLENGAKFDAFDIDDGTPLHCAVGSGSFEVCQLLLEQEGGLRCLTLKQQQGHLPIHYAATASPKILRLLLEKGANADVSVDQEGSWAHRSTALSKACEQKEKNEEMVQILLDAGADPNKDVGRGKTPFLIAVISGNKSAVKSMLDKGLVDLKLAMDSDTPPLLAAATKGHFEICKILIEAGFDPNISSTDDNDYTPLHNAAGYGNGDTIRVLVGNKANIEACTSDGRRPLHMACFKGRLDCVRKLIRFKADIESNDCNGWNALHFAACYGHLEIVKLLLKPGIFKPATTRNITSGGPGENSSECTAADLAKSNGYDEIVGILLEAGDFLTLETEISDEE
jgi:ankyrin repeat protein